MKSSFSTSAGTAKLGTGVPAAALPAALAPGLAPPPVPAVAAEPLLEHAARKALAAANVDPCRNPRRLILDSAIRWSCACRSCSATVPPPPFDRRGGPPPVIASLIRRGRDWHPRAIGQQPGRPGRGPFRRSRR